MSEEIPNVESEIDSHHEEIDKWIVSVETLDITSSHKGVVERFVRDCKTLKSDMDVNETPQAADLVDFMDRRNSLEIQYFNITEDLK